MLRAGQALATWQSPGREDGRGVHELYTSSAGDFSAAFGFRPHSGRNDIINKADKKPSPLGEGGTSASEANRVADEGNRIPIINVTSFSPHPSCLRNASAIHLPPRGEGLIGCVHDCHLGALVEKSPAIETARFIYAPAHLPARVPRREIPPRQKRNRTYTNNPNTCPQGLPAAPAHLPARVPRREIPCDRNENNRTRLNQAFTRCGSPH